MATFTCLFFLLNLWICVCAFPCGLGNVCNCFTHTKLATCARRNLRSFPQFTKTEEKNIQILILRWNKINQIPRKEFIQNLGKIDLRENPLNCSLLPPWSNIVSDCLMSTKKTISDSLITTKKLQQVTISTKPTNPTSVTTTLSKSSTLVKFFSKVTTVKYTTTTSFREQISTEQGLFHETTSNRKETTIYLSSLFSTESSIHKQTTSSMPAEQSQSDDSVEFFLHVTLGPIAVLYIVSTMIWLIKRWCQRRTQYRRTNLSNET